MGHIFSIMFDVFFAMFGVSGVLMWCCCSIAEVAVSLPLHMLVFLFVDVFSMSTITVHVRYFKDELGRSKATAAVDRRCRLFRARWARRELLVPVMHTTEDAFVASLQILRISPMQTVSFQSARI